MTSLSRNDLAQHLADLIAGKEMTADAITAAAQLVKDQSHDVDLLIEDVKYYLETGHKVSNPTVTSARELTDASKAEITKMIESLTGATVSETDYRTDESVIGGAKVATATTEVDMTVQTMLSNIKG